MGYRGDGLGALDDDGHPVLDNVGRVGRVGRVVHDVEGVSVAVEVGQRGDLDPVDEPIVVASGPEAAFAVVQTEAALSCRFDPVGRNVVELRTVEDPSVLVHSGHGDGWLEVDFGGQVPNYPYARYASCEDGRTRLVCGEAHSSIWDGVLGLRRRQSGTALGGQYPFSGM